MEKQDQSIPHTISLKIIIYPIDKYIITGFMEPKNFKWETQKNTLWNDFHTRRNSGKAMMDGEVTLSESDMYFTGEPLYLTMDME